MMKSFVLLLILCAWIPPQALAATARVRELNGKDESYLRQKLPALFKDNVQLSTLDEAIRLLMERGTYENVFVERLASGNFEVIGKPIRTVEAIEFHGLNQVNEEDLREFLEFKIGDRFDRKRAVAAAEKMKNYYGEQGYFNAIIELSFQKTQTQNIKVVYEIQEKKPCLIQGLEFDTTNTDLKAKLESHFRDLKHRPLTAERSRRLTSGMTSFLIKNRYLAAEVVGPEASYNDDKTTAYLKFEIRNPYRWEFYMDGYKHFTLTDVYHALDLENHDRKNMEPASEAAERLRRAYLSDGFPSIQIETKVINPKGTYLKRVYYQIHEGPRAKLKTIAVQGRISRPSSYYENFIRANSSDLIERGYFNRQDLENGVKNLVTELRNQGFLRARALSSRVELNEKRDEATVYLLLEEGIQTQIRAVDFDGNKFFSSFELAQVTGLDTNTALHLGTFESSLEKLKAFYHNQGFLEMKLLNENEDLIQYNDKGTQARILFRIYEGPRIRVNSIVVEGNSLTQSHVILKEADFRLGEVLTPQKIEDATARLNKLALFSRVEIHTMEENTNVADRTLVISVSERDPGVVRVGAGVTNERNLTIRGFSGFSYSNLFGTARAVSIRGEIKQNVAQINYPEHEVTAGYLEPFIFNTRTRGRVNLTRSEYIFNYEPTNRETDITTTNRVDFLAERDLTLHTKLTWKVWTLESNKDRERYGRCIPDDTNDNFDPNSHCSPSTQQVATIGPTLDIDYRDSAFLPTRGSRFLITSDYSDPRLGSSTGIEFTRTEANFTHYTRLHGKDWIWANSLRGGYEANLSSRDGSGIPSNYAFLLGGISTVRGFDLASDSERIPKQGNDGFNVTRGNQLLVHSDSNYFLIKTELRFPIYGDHGGVLFYDGGDVNVSGYHFHRPYRDAFGIGYRYNTPVGPLALDLAFKVRPEPDEAPFRFHLSIGTF